MKSSFVLHIVITHPNRILSFFSLPIYRDLSKIHFAAFKLSQKHLPCDLYIFSFEFLYLSQPALSDSYSTSVKLTCFRFVLLPRVSFSSLVHYAPHVSLSVMNWSTNCNLSRFLYYTAQHSCRYLKSNVNFLYYINSFVL